MQGLQNMGPERSGIYQIRHIGTGVSYVSSSINMAKRWCEDYRDLENKAHTCKRLQSVWNYYGSDAFIFEVVELTNDLTVRETFWRAKLRSVGQAIKASG